MGKHILSKRKIQKLLNSKLKIRKSIAVWLELFLYASLILLICINISLRTVSAPVLFLYAVVFSVLFYFLYKYYYSIKYEVKKGKYVITEEKLMHKDFGIKKYYRHVEKENYLYFQSGRIAVNSKVYSYSNTGDSFYVVKLKSQKSPIAVYSMKYYIWEDKE